MLLINLSTTYNFSSTKNNFAINRVIMFELNGALLQTCYFLQQSILKTTGMLISIGFMIASLAATSLESMKPSTLEKSQKEFNVLVHDLVHLDPYGTVSFDITPCSTGKQVAFPHPLFAINNLGNSMILLRLCDLFLMIIISKVEKMQYLKILLVS